MGRDSSVLIKKQVHVSDMNLFCLGEVDSISAPN